MSAKKKLPPIQPAPVQRFTLRLIDGHFVRVPRLENLPITDATRPPTTSRPPDGFPHGDGVMLPRGLRLVDGHFINGAESGTNPEAIPATPLSPAESKKQPSPDSWDYPFITRLDPPDSAA